MADFYNRDYEEAIRDPALTRFHRAAVNGNTELMVSCLPRDINEPYRGFTALHLAVYRGKAGTVQTLLERGARVGVKDTWGWTPLHRASYRNNKAVVQLLLDHGADISARDRGQKTPMQVALDWKKFEPASLMLTKTASPQQTWVHKVVTTAKDTPDWEVKMSILRLCEHILLNQDLNFKDDKVLCWSGLSLTDTSLREKLQELPKDIRYRTLFLYNNQISTLPNLQTYGQLKSLSYLVISNNPIHTIEGLPLKLKIFYCKSTKIEVLGKACFHKSCFKVLKQALQDGGRYDSLKQPPYQVFERGISDILRYFTKELVTNSQYRVVAIGDTGAGKSSCLESVILGQPYLTHEADRTHVLDLKHWRVSNEDFFTFFDQGGHEVYDITNPYFVSIKSMVLIFQDLCKTQNVPRTLDILRRSLHQHSQNAIHFVLTHIDQVHQVKQSVQSFKKEIQELLQGEIATFQRLLASPKNKGYIQEKDIQSLLEHCEKKLSSIQYFPISSKTYTGIEELKTFLKSTIGKQRVNIPTLWIDCLQKMEESKLSFWTKSKLMKVMNVSQSQNQVSQSGSPASPLDSPVSQSGSGQDETGVVDCLRYLNDTGMVIWMEDHDTLNEYIFHQLEFLIEVLKSLFHHDLKSTIQYDTDHELQLVFTETEFEHTLKKYQEEGILKFTFLQYLWRKYKLHEKDELALIALIRLFHLFSEIPSDQDREFFVPWFVKKNKAPPNFNVIDPLVINSNEVSLNMECLFHNRLPLNVTEHFLVEVQGYMYEQCYRGSRYAWADGLRVQIDETTITAFRNVDQAKLSLVITAEFDYLVEMWDALQQLNECLKSILKFYHGSLRSHHSNCLHCKKVGIGPVHRWLQDEVLPKRPYKDLFMCCDKDKTAKVPAALVTRMPNDDKKQERLDMVRIYLRTGSDFPTDTQLHDLAKKIGNEIQEIAARLGLENAEVEQIKRNHPGNAHNQNFQVFLKWRESNDQSAGERSGILQASLRSIGREPLVTMVGEWYKQYKGKELPQDMPSETDEKLSQQVPKETGEKFPQQLPSETDEKLPEEVPSETDEKLPQQVPTETDEKLPQQVPTETDEKLPEEVPSETDEKLPQQVPTETDEKLPQQVPSETDVKLPQEVPTETDEKLPQQVPSETDVKLPQEVPTETDEKLPQQVPSETDVKLPQEVPSETDEKIRQQVPSETDVKLPQEVPSETDKKIRQEVPSETDEKIRQQVPSETDVKLPQEVPSETDKKIRQQVPLETDKKIRQEVPSETDVKIRQEVPLETDKKIRQQVPSETDVKIRQEVPIETAPLHIRPVASSTETEVNLDEGGRLTPLLVRPTVENFDYVQDTGTSHTGSLLESEHTEQNSCRYCCSRLCKCRCSVL